jgi:hypothetical protein
METRERVSATFENSIAGKAVIWQRQTVAALALDRKISQEYK